MSKHNVQVEIEFTIQHSMDELKDRFVRLGQLPEWESVKVSCDECASNLAFLEKRVVSIYLNNEAERYAWFVFSMEACGELKQRIVIPNIISSAQNIDNLDLGDFLKLCRECLVGSPAPPAP